MRTPAQTLYALLGSFALLGLICAASVAPGQSPAPELAVPGAAVEATAPSGQSDDGPAESDGLAENGAIPLEQGPVHEAFAAPVGQFGAAPQELSETVIKKQPPATIDELPPAERPEGTNVQWIPGYWMWSVDREDFVWVSGVWRDVPPGRQWTPGSWVEVDGGYAWSPGYWASTATTEVAYLPAPPASLEEGPSSPAPGDDYFWIPGCWSYANQNYQWRPGYWYRSQPNWVWVPSYYNRTPGGYIFVNGYWDMPLYQRGVLYAPVYWNSPIYGRPGYAYRPRSVVNTALLVTSLFVNPYRNHYYYGSYGPGYRNQGLYPWFGYGSGGFGRAGLGGYDPLFSYYRYGGRNAFGPNFNDLRRDYARFDNDRFDGNRGPGGRGPDNRDGHDGRGYGRDVGSLIAANVGDLGASAGRPNMRQLDDATRQRITANLDQTQRFRDRRAQIEGNGPGRDGAGLSADARGKLGLDGRGPGGERHQVMRVPLEDYGVSNERIQAARTEAARAQANAKNLANEARRNALDRARGQGAVNNDRAPSDRGPVGNRGENPAQPGSDNPSTNNPLNNNRPSPFNNNRPSIDRPTFNREDALQRFRNQQGPPNNGVNGQSNPNFQPNRSPSDNARQDALNRFRGQPGASGQPTFRNPVSDAASGRIEQRSNFRGPVQGASPLPQRNASPSMDASNPRSFNRPSFSAPQRPSAPGGARSFNFGGGNPGGGRPGGFSGPHPGGGGPGK